MRIQHGNARITEEWHSGFNIFEYPNIIQLSVTVLKVLLAQRIYGRIHTVLFHTTDFYIDISVSSSHCFHYITSKCVSYFSKICYNTTHHFIILMQVVQIIHPPYYYMSSPCCHIWMQETKSKAFGCHPVA